MKELREQLILNPNSKPGYTLNHGVIRYKGRLVIGSNETLKKKILSSLYESPLGGHLGIQNTYYKVKQIFFWSQLKRCVIEYVLTCDTCSHWKHETIASPSLL